MMYFWAALEKNIPFLLNFVFTIVLARLISPDAYGLVAMTSILTALATVIQNMGLTSALVQRKTLSDDDPVTVFAVNIGVGSVIACLLFLSAPLIADFFERSEVELVVRANALCLVIAAFAAVQTVMLQREFRFRTGLIVETSATLVAGGVAIFIALRGYELLALLALMVARQLVQTSLLWLLVRWWPQGKFSLESFRSLWAFARHMIGASLYHHAATNLVSVLLGRFTSAATLGLFARAQSLQTLPVALISQPIQRVSFPLLSKHQDDTKELRRILALQTRPIAMLAAFATAALAACANELVLILVGEAWAQSIPILQILAFAAFFQIQFPIHSEANKAIGKSGWFFRVELLKKTLLIIAVIIGINFGVTGLAWALVASSAIDYVLSATATVRFIGYTWREQFFTIAPNAAVCFVAIAAALGGTVLLLEQPLLVLISAKLAIIGLTFLIAILVGRERYAGIAYTLLMRVARFRAVSDGQ